jgi:hypothetical protein
MDVSVLPAGAQAQMAALSIDSSVITSLTGTPAPSSGGLFATPAVSVDISEEARAAALAANDQTGYDAGDAGDAD